LVGGAAAVGVLTSLTELSDFAVLLDVFAVDEELHPESTAEPNKTSMVSTLRKIRILTDLISVASLFLSSDTTHSN
jgi:hypothetical protein